MGEYRACRTLLTGQRGLYPASLGNWQFFWKLVSLARQGHVLCALSAERDLCPAAPPELPSHISPQLAMSNLLLLSLEHLSSREVPWANRIMDQESEG